jgi:hypothetical protein
MKLLFMAILYIYIYIPNELFSVIRSRDHVYELNVW